MKKTLPLLLSIFFTATLLGQTFEQISTGGSYANQQFYDLDSKTGVTISSEDWDLMFTAFGLQDAGIHVNEAVNLSFGAPAPAVELYLAETSDFASVTTFDTNFVRLYNDEISWANGALNVNLVPENPLDYGWGVYNPATRQVVGDDVFIIKLRSGEFKKFMIETLDATVYNIKHADLNGENEQIAAIDKNNYSSGLIPFSFASNEALNLEIDGFDFLYTRYQTVLFDPGTGGDLDYFVTGILSAPGVEVAKIEGTDPAEVNADTEIEFSSELDALGFDWKNFSFSEGWILPEDLTYVVKTAEGKLYKMVFIDFEGSSTGTATFELSELGTVSSVQKVNSTFEDAQIFPNPVRENLNITYSLKQAHQNVQLELYNPSGQIVWTTQTNGNKGLNARTFVLPDFPMGTYFLNIQAGDYSISRKVMIKK
ncbi:MAG: T9SS type A sorting domain-containing protein [Bacteroidota bacterium]